MSFPALAATGIGSVPFTETSQAVTAVLQHLPEMPFWPQLVKRGFLEDMVSQGAGGLPLVQKNLEKKVVEIGPGNREEALTTFYEAVLAGDLTPFALHPEEAAGFFGLLDAVAQLPPETGPAFLKGQIIGPVTFASIVKGPDGKAALFDPELNQAFTQGLGLKAAWQAARIQESGRQAVIFFDEPSLTGFGSAFMQISRQEVIDQLTAAITAAKEHGQLWCGIHCCGNTDWAMLLETPIDILSFDSYGFFETFKLYHQAIAGFLERGGWLAWGLIPTSPQAPPETAESLWQRWLSQIQELEALGFDRQLLLQRSLLTPACGLGYLEATRAEESLALLADLSQRARQELLA